MSCWSEADTPPPLSRETWEQLMTMLEEMDLLVDRLDEEPEEVWRQAQESQVHATLDAIERPPTSPPVPRPVTLGSR